MSTAHIVDLTCSHIERVASPNIGRVHSIPCQFTYLDLLYSNSMCKQSSIPTSILMLLFISGYRHNVWTTMSSSLTTSVSRFTIVTRRKYLVSEKHQANWGCYIFENQRMGSRQRNFIACVWGSVTALLVSPDAKSRIPFSDITSQTLSKYDRLCIQDLLFSLVNVTALLISYWDITNIECKHWILSPRSLLLFCILFPVKVPLTPTPI